MWQWQVSLPEDVNPNVAGSTEFCGYGQFGPLFFLPGSSSDEPANTTCVVAKGTTIYVSAGGECSTVEPPPFFGRTEDELRACVTAVMEGSVPFGARINGQDVGDLGRTGSVHRCSHSTFRRNNIFGVEPGVAQAVSEDHGLAGRVAPSASRGSM